MTSEEVNVIRDKRSMIELKKLIQFSSNLVIKNEDEAELTETFESNSIAYRFINAMLFSDTLDDYEVTASDLAQLDTSEFKYSQFNPQSIPSKYQEHVLNFKRFQLYQEYMRNGDPNPYYENIYKNYVSDGEYIYHTLDEFVNNNNLCFYVRARMSENYSLLYAPVGILNQEEAAQFKRCFNQCQIYFNASLYNEAYKIGNPKYSNFVMLCIVFMTIKAYLNSRLENIDNIDFFDEYSIRNMFLSYGLDYFFDMPLKYQKRLLKNINELIKNKGTDKAIVDILALFGFEDIKIFKYILAKDYKQDVNGKLDIKNPELKFYAISSDYMDIEEGIINSREHTYDEITSEDPYWQLDEQDKLKLMQEHFNYFNTKYLEVSSMMNLLKYSMDFSYFTNLLFRIESKLNKNDRVTDRLHFYNYLMSPKKINVIHAFLVMQILVLKKFGYKDTIVKEPNSIAKVYDFNFDNIAREVTFYKDRVLEPKTINNFKTNNMRKYRENDIIDGPELVDLFVENNNFRKALERNINNTKNYRTFRTLKALHKVSFISNYRKELFNGYETFTEYLMEKDPNLVVYIESVKAKVDAHPDEAYMIYDESIMEVANSIDAYLEDNDLDFLVQGNIYLTDYIKEFIYQLVDFLKSYTVHIRDINTIYVFDDKFLNTVRFFDESEFQIKMSHKQLLAMNEELGIKGNLTCSIDELEKLGDAIKLKSIITRFEKVIDKNNEVIAWHSKQSFIDLLAEYRDKINDIHVSFEELDSIYNILRSESFSVETIYNFDKGENIILKEGLEMYCYVIMELGRELLNITNEKIDINAFLDIKDHKQLYEELKLFATLNLMSKDERLSNHYNDKVVMKPILNLADLTLNSARDIGRLLTCLYKFEKILLKDDSDRISFIDITSDKILEVLNDLIKSICNRSTSGLVSFIDSVSFFSNLKLLEQINIKDEFEINSSDVYPNYAIKLTQDELNLIDVENNHYTYMLHNLSNLDSISGVIINNNIIENNTIIKWQVLDDSKLVIQSKMDLSNKSVEIIFKDIKINTKKRG